MDVFGAIQSVRTEDYPKVFHCPRGRLGSPVSIGSHRKLPERVETHTAPHGDESQSVPTENYRRGVLLKISEKRFTFQSVTTHLECVAVY